MKAAHVQPSSPPSLKSLISKSDLPMGSTTQFLTNRSSKLCLLRLTKRIEIRW